MTIGVDRRVHDLAEFFLDDAGMDWPADDFSGALWDKAVDEFAEELQGAIEDRLTGFEACMTLHLALREVGLAACMRSTGTRCSVRSPRCGSRFALRRQRFSRRRKPYPGITRMRAGTSPA